MFLARFWGWLALVFALVLLLRPARLRELKLPMIDDRGFSLSYGIVSLVLGLASVLLYDAWTPDWRSLASLSGWLALLKGIYVLAFNDLSRKPTLETRLLTTRVALVAVAALGSFMIVASHA
ncbi:MAG TPA: hypothetical protein DDZ67_01265 [Xanthomonadaceae bacterium]|nr:hypothetical protein [Xanthomonadaceae bacterium]